MLDLANNTVQGPARALLADLSGPDQHNSSNAIFCLWMAVGNILGFSVGASGSWHRWFPFLESRACCEACANLKETFLVALVFHVLLRRFHFHHQQMSLLVYQILHLCWMIPHKMAFSTQSQNLMRLLLLILTGAVLIMYMNECQTPNMLIQKIQMFKMKFSVMRLELY